MTFVPIADTVQVQMCFIWDGQKVENTYHFRYAAGPTVPGMTALAVAMRDWWETELKGIAPAYFSLAKIIVTDLSYQTAPGIEYADDMPISGTAAGDSMPNSVCVAVTWTTGMRGRSYRGRTYHMPLLISQVQGNLIPGSDASGLAAAYGALMTLTPTVAVPTFVVASRYANGQARTAGITTNVTGVSVNTTIDSQRRRLPERGQ